MTKKHLEIYIFIINYPLYYYIVIYLCYLAFMRFYTVSLITINYNLVVENVHGVVCQLVQLVRLHYSFPAS